MASHKEQVLKTVRLMMSRLTGKERLSVPHSIGSTPKKLRSMGIQMKAEGASAVAGVNGPIGEDIDASGRLSNAGIGRNWFRGTTTDAASYSVAIGK
jgi:hypothetical protein